MDFTEHTGHASNILIYAMLHIYPQILSDTQKMLVYPLGTEVNLKEIKKNFKRFMIKDFVKSEKGSSIPKFFDSDISEKDFFYWLKVFKEYRSKLFTGGICIKEHVDLKNTMKTQMNGEFFICLEMF